MRANERPARGARRRRVLVVVDDACSGTELCDGVRAFAAGARVEALVVAPAHGTAATQWYVDEDAARADATHRLRACVNCLAQEGVSVSGELSDPDPMQAIADALRHFPADEILLVTAALRPSRWLRPNVAERARRTFRQPITEIETPIRPEGSET